jgi:hypothetical protein
MAISLLAYMSGLLFHVDKGVERALVPELANFEVPLMEQLLVEL